ncbi:hypothetical protein HMPREF9439_00876 [Parasutterella excrementihominis YIT 11859]|uniref:Uncharacterized protein n=1 Tax=Parasutterella excrementihominis YIT 11859 TaxID=762966 RepID=F3QIX7_9BURK|nr:hypothetical protein HMPREF9439_00876 [Parasutterella excrementihominis YIT 11859]
MAEADRPKAAAKRKGRVFLIMQTSVNFQESIQIQIQLCSFLCAFKVHEIAAQN